MQHNSRSVTESCYGDVRGQSPSPRSVTESSYGDVFFYVSEGCKPESWFKGVWGATFFCPRVVNPSPRSVTESSLGDGIFFFSTTTYGGAYVVVVMFVCLSVQLFVRVTI
jgi:hypothetical protein